VIFVSNLELSTILSNIRQKEKIKTGDIVIGQIVVVKDNMVVVEIVNAGNSVLSPADMGVLFVKNIDTKFVESTSDCFSKGDVIKAKIMEVGPYEYKLVTNSQDLGVIRTICKRCKNAIGASPNEEVTCQCGNTIKKKFAKNGDL
jgi:exosome complex component CSL4